MQVAILHNAVADDASAADRDTLVQVEVVARALRELGHGPVPVPCTLDLETARRDLLAARPDVVFNLIESLGGSDWLMFLGPGLLDSLALPYTGAPTAGMFFCAHKLLAKHWMLKNDLPTPAWLAVDEPFAGAWPTEASWIIKAINEHASFGLDEESILHAPDEATLRQRVAADAAKMGRACFAEQYIDGREFNLSVLGGPKGPQVLPPAEIDFSAFPPGKARVVGHRAKWEEGTFEFTNTPRRFDFSPSDGPLLQSLRRLARACWDLFGLRGYARVDFRVDHSGRPWILEMNADPCLSPDAGFAAALAEAGISFPQAVQRILDDAFSGQKGPACAAT